MNRFIPRVLVILSTILILSSCASASKKFTAQTKVNIGFFADQTIAVLSDSDFGFTRNETLYTREFFDLNGEEEKESISLRKEADEFFTGIIKYSLGLVQMVESKKTAAEQVAAYHDFITNLNAKILDNLEVEPDHYDDIKRRVGEAEKFLDALRAAQPIINAGGRYMYQILDRSDVALDVLVEKLDRKIDEEYAEVIQYQESLETEKYNILRSLSHLYRAYKGNLEAYTVLAKSESIHRKDLIADPPPSDEDLKVIAEFLQSRLAALHIIENEIKGDWETYRAAHRELDMLHEKAKRVNSKARLIVLIWLRAHQKMASGEASPAEWFDVKSLPSTLINMGVKSVY